jgi:hypothetical protein
LFRQSPASISSATLAFPIPAALTCGMPLTLLVPGLFWPREILRDTAFDLPLPALNMLLGRGRRSSCGGIDDWLARTFGLPAPLPSAPLRLLGDGGSPGDGHWLCLDPVHLRIQERAMVVEVPGRLALSAHEDEELRRAIAPLFDGELVAPAPGRWHLRLDQPAALDTLPLPDAVGRPAPTDLPAGPDGAHWRRLLAEAQPMLHAHAVNRRRDESGLPTVNSLWPWGAGRLPAAAHRTFDPILADEPVLKGIAHLAGIAARPAPARYAAPVGSVLVRFDQLAEPAAAFDALAWREALMNLERDWLAPALAALRSGEGGELRVVAEGTGTAAEIAVTRSDLWRFWRQPMPLWEAVP